MHKAVTGCVEAKKLLSRRKQSNYTTVGILEPRIRMMSITLTYLRVRSTDQDDRLLFFFFF